MGEPAAFDPAELAKRLAATAAQPSDEPPSRGDDRAANDGRDQGCTSRPRSWLGRIRTQFKSVSVQFGSLMNCLRPVGLGMPKSMKLE